MRSLELLPALPMSKLTDYITVWAFSEVDINSTKLLSSQGRDMGP